MKRTRLVVPVVAVAASVLVLAGCGGSDSKVSDAEASSAASIMSSMASASSSAPADLESSCTSLVEARAKNSTAPISYKRGGGSGPREGYTVSDIGFDGAATRTEATAKVSHPYWEIPIHYTLTPNGTDATSQTMRETCRYDGLSNEAVDLVARS